MLRNENTEKTFTAFIGIYSNGGVHLENLSGPAFMTSEAESWTINTVITHGRRQDRPRPVMAIAYQCESVEQVREVYAMSNDLRLAYARASAAGDDIYKAKEIDDVSLRHVPAAAEQFRASVRGMEVDVKYTAARPIITVQPKRSWGYKW